MRAALFQQIFQSNKKMKDRSASHGGAPEPNTPKVARHDPSIKMIRNDLYFSILKW
jgi:hypothetical protein